MFFKSKSKTETKTKIILGMVMLRSEQTFNLDDLIADVRNNYDNAISNITGDNATALVEIDGEMLAIGHMQVPIPEGDIASTAEYAYNWENAVEDLKHHQSHLIVSAMGKIADPIVRYKIFTRVICALLRTTDSIGVYKGNQSLLIPKDEYIGEATLMSDYYLPLNLWIYFGLRTSSSGQSGYTYGLREFGKTEMEVIDSTQSLLDIRALLFNMAHYVLEYDITFKDGQTCGMSEEQKIKISMSKGKFVEGRTFKLAY